MLQQGDERTWRRRSHGAGRRGGWHLSFLLLLLSFLLLPSFLAAGEPEPGESSTAMEARIWFDRGVDPVFQRGDRVRVYFRSNRDAYTAIFHLDTNGRVELVFPSAPGDPQWVRGAQDYRLLLPGSTYWTVNEDPGMGYYFILTSAEPLDYSALGYSPLGGGWDLSRVASRVYTDPYVAMDDFVEALLPEWEYVEFDLDYVVYHVGQSYSYPRFLCYDCHTAQPWSNWNPYHQACSSFRVVIYNDPHYYPSTRYRGTRVVYSRPPLSRQAQFEFKERAAGEPGTPLVRNRGTTGGTAGGTLPRELTEGNLTREGTGPDRGSRVPLRTELDGPTDGGRLPTVIRGRTGAPTASPDGLPRPRADERPTVPEGRSEPPAPRSRPVLERRPPRSPPSPRPADSARPPRGGGGSGSDEARRPSRDPSATPTTDRNTRPSAGAGSRPAPARGSRPASGGGDRPSASQGSRPSPGQAGPRPAPPPRPSAGGQRPPATSGAPSRPAPGNRPAPPPRRPPGGGGGE